MVGEKLRALKRRRRQDILAGLRNHEIGYHTNLHSVHPTVAEYLKDLGWEEGIEEFDMSFGMLSTSARAKTRTGLAGLFQE
ncbi:MAG TPA: hypothetical protein GX509_03175 [Firmicutes bacterium]|nr:hypothetical protein [Bacillota bacterium]